MGYIREPKGIDFVVVPQTKPNPEADRLVSEFLSQYRLKNKASMDRTAAKALAIIRKYKALHRQD